MSVYKSSKSPYWQYDFQYQGRRFYGSTGQETKRNAETVERKRRLEAATGSLDSVATWRLDTAAGKWWTEKGSARGDAEDVERRLQMLLDLFGKNTLLGEINQVTVSEAIEAHKRRMWTKTAAKGAKAYKRSPATVNRDVIETLRPILRRAKTHWTPVGALHGLPEIDWRELRLAEPRPVSRSYTASERRAWWDACDPDARLALDLLLTNGLRFGELFFSPDIFKDDPVEPVLMLQKGRKVKVTLFVPLRAEHAREIAARVTRAKEAGLPHIWFYQKRAGSRTSLEAYTEHQIRGKLLRGARKAGVSGGRLIHNARHHAGNTVLRKSGGNLKAVQGLLGHASINSSQRYSAILTSELRTLLDDDVYRNSPELPSGENPESKAG